MAGILDISASVPEATIRDFTRACTRYRDELGNNQTVAIRRGTIALIRGLRARTAKAKPMVPPRDVVKYDGDGPKYITPKGHNQKSVRRWTIIRKRGTPQEYRRTAVTERKMEARRQRGTIELRGLARQSWGWFMALLFGRQSPNDMRKMRKADRRLVEGYRKEVVTGPNPRIEITMINRLGYICEALPEAALSEAMAAATRYIDGQIDKGLAKARKELT